jgi:hypothetical protein
LHARRSDLWERLQPRSLLPVQVQTCLDALPCSPEALAAEAAPTGTDLNARGFKQHRWNSGCKGRVAARLSTEPWTLGDI